MFTSSPRCAWFFVRGVGLYDCRGARPPRDDPASVSAMLARAGSVRLLDHRSLALAKVVGRTGGLRLDAWIPARVQHLVNVDVNEQAEPERLEEVKNRPFFAVQ